MTWNEALQSGRGRWTIAFCIAGFLFMFLYIPGFYQTVLLPKPGWTPADFPFPDFILDLFVPRDWSLITFGILYVTIGHTVIASRRKPDVILTGIALYCAINILRVLTMYMFTLEPPEGMILLRDPISSLLYPDNGFAKDLFFSGHISTMMIMVLIEPSRTARYLKVAGTVLMGIFLAWQHVHYTVDLVAAPFITYGVYRIVKRWVEIPLQTGNTTMDH